MTIIKKRMPPIEVINERLEITPDFILVNKKRKGVKCGREAGHQYGNYRRVVINKSRYLTHRIIYFMMTGIDPMDLEVDHVDGNTSNNRIENLRMATRAQNGSNRKINENNKLGIKGVHIKSRNGKYCAFIKKDGVKINLGEFSDKHAAAMAYQSASEKLFGEYKRAEIY